MSGFTRRRHDGETCFYVEASVFGDESSRVSHFTDKAALKRIAAPSRPLVPLRKIAPSDLGTLERRAMTKVKRLLIVRF